MVPALIDAQALGWPIDDKVRDAAVEYVRKCALPNGAFSYDLTPVPRAMTGEGINDVKGSLGRIQVCNWALRRAGVAAVDDAHVRMGLEQFFEYHKFLEMLE